MLKKVLKLIIIFVLAFLVTFYNYYDLNVLLAIPLFSFAFFNGICPLIFYLLGMIIGSYFNFYLTNSYIMTTYLLIAMVTFILLFFIFSIFNKKLLVNYFVSSLLAILLTYLFYFFNSQIEYKNIFIIFILATFITMSFSYIVKYFSFYLNKFTNNLVKILFFTFIVSIIGSISFINNIYINYAILASLFILIITFALKNDPITVLAFNACYYIASICLNIPIINELFFYYLLTSFTLSICKSKYNALNSLTFLAIIAICYFINSNINLIFIICTSLVCAIYIVYINAKVKYELKDIYYQSYIQNKEEMLLQLKNFEEMFENVGENFKIAKIDKMLKKVNDEVFNTLCKDCINSDYCYKNKNHLLLNYLRNYLNNSLTDEMIEYVKKNCLKQKAYFLLLDSFTKKSLLTVYEEEPQTKIKEIIANDFYSFSKVMNNCSTLVKNDRLYIENNFYQNIKQALKDEGFDVLYVINHSTIDSYCFDVALKIASKNKIKTIFLNTINDILKTNMEIINVDFATLSSNYYIITIKEVKELKIDFAFKQSNENLNANGDSLLSFEKNNSFYLGISDGMGNGLNANQESNFALKTISSMIKANMDIKTSIKITNDIVLLKNDEDGYTTLDLLVVNKKNKIASFYKHGAITSYIIRNNKITEVSNFSLPLGVNKDANIEPISFKIESDDIIILCSDGMIDDYDSNVNYILEEVSLDSAIVICDSLFTHLIEKRKNCDDATLAIVVIK